MTFWEGVLDALISLIPPAPNGCDFLDHASLHLAR